MRAVLVPGVLALLPSYAGLVDPVAELRAACEKAVAWLVEDGSPVTVLADDQGSRVAHALLGDAPTGAGAAYLVVGNGSARRSERAPGHLDERAAGFDRDLEAFLRGAGALPDPALARELWASTQALERVHEDGSWGTPVVDYADDPFGVQYWVMRWSCAS